MRRIVIILCLAAAGGVFSQDVIRVSRPFVLLSLTEGPDVGSGSTLPVERLLPSGGRVEVGRVKILFFRDSLCAARIVKEDPFLTIQEGDRLLYNRSGPKPAGSRGAALPDLTFFKAPAVSYTSAGLGLICGGMGYFYFRRAADTADIIPTDNAHFLRLSSKVNSFDNRSNMFQALSAGFLVFSAVHYFFIRETPADDYGRVSFSAAPSPGTAPLLCLRFSLDSR